jgi:PAS domain S-box-containing protein
LTRGADTLHIHNSPLHKNDFSGKQVSPTERYSTDLVASCRPAPADSEARHAVLQAELGKESDAFRRAFEDAAIGMAIVDLDGRFRKVNHSLCEMVGYSESELLNLTFQDITHPDDLAADLELARRMMAGEMNHYHLEKRYRHKDGHEVWIQLSGSLIRDREDRPCYCVSQIQDITARKVAEQEAAARLRDMQRLTHTANQLLRAFETGEDEHVYTEVLQIALAAFESKAGLFLRFEDDGTLIGPYRGAGVSFSPRCTPENCDLWVRVIEERRVIAENTPRAMGCGLPLERSLAGPILYNDQVLGIIHLGNAPQDYSLGECDLLTRILQLSGPALYARMRLSSLTTREIEVMDMIVMGLSQKQIATMLSVSVQTVAKHRARVLDKLAVRNDVDLVYFALKKRSNRLFDPASFGAYGSVGHGILRPPLQAQNGVQMLAQRRQQ